MSAKVVCENDGLLIGAVEDYRILKVCFSYFNKNDQKDGQLKFIILEFPR